MMKFVLLVLALVKMTFAEEVILSPQEGDHVEKMVVSLGGSAYLQCNITEEERLSPFTQTRWFHGCNEVVFDNVRFYRLRRHFLLFLSVQEDDKGEYTCMKIDMSQDTSVVPLVRHMTHFQVHIGTVGKVVLEAIETGPGELTFVCQGYNWYPQALPLWKGERIGGVPLSKSATMDIYFNHKTQMYSSNSSLVIDGAIVMSYVSCVVSNSYGAVTKTFQCKYMIYLF